MDGWRCGTNVLRLLTMVIMTDVRCDDAHCHIRCTLINVIAAVVVITYSTSHGSSVLTAVCLSVCLSVCLLAQEVQIPLRYPENQLASWFARWSATC